MTAHVDFQNLTPDIFINAVESAIKVPMTGLLSPLPSYINRVYEMQDMDGRRVIAKFYRPGRWSLDMLKDEHDYIMDCHGDEIPVVPPMILANGKTLDNANGIYFAVFPKRSGREFEITEDEDWKRMGRVIARMHIAGCRKEAPSRLRLHPSVSTANDIKALLAGTTISKPYRESFQDVTKRILDHALPLFDTIKTIRVHGDCHQKNLIYRPDEGIMIIDFDDMMTGPSVQDLWLFLPDHLSRSRTEMDLILEGYTQFRDFDPKELRLVEPLRAMRMIYFLAWLAKQSNDFQFRKTFPDWGSDQFWKNEIADLYKQIQVMTETISNGNSCNY